ncbi:hypothetical protein CEW92_01915 [Bacillaceae bacterium SAS-127]|nr:hypothetical protein CEW92_01915 [Bacillaceae bacterium SAS-127]
MSKYNLGQNESEKCALTIADLCKEIAEENPNSEHYSFDTLRDKFKNHDKSGIIDKLEIKLGFRIENFDKYDQLKLLKYLFQLEKSSLSKSIKSYNNAKIRIIDILNKPRLDNINTHIAEKNIYGNILSEMKANIEKELSRESIVLKIEQLEYITLQWEIVIQKTFDYVMTEIALHNKEFAYSELERIEYYLKHKVLERLPNVLELKLQYNENLFSTFYNILILHESLCFDHDRLRINYQIVIDDPPENDYIKTFIENEDKWLVKEEYFEILLKKLCNLDERYDSKLGIIIFLIFKKNKLSDEDKKNLKFAFRHVKTLLIWLKEFKKADFSEGYHLGIFVSVIQEIIYASKTKEILKNDFYGNKYYQKTLISSLKDGVEASAVAKTAWLFKIENRYSVNIGAYKLIKKKRDVEKLIYQIKSKLYQYHNMSDLELANSMIINFTSRSLISRKIAEDILLEFVQQVVEICGLYEFRIFKKGINVLNMCREFLLCRETMQVAAKDIGEMIIEFDFESPTNSYSKIIAKSMSYRFCLKSNDRTFLVLFYVDRERKVVDFKNFMEVVDDEYANEQIRIGLGKFIYC